MGVIQDCRGRRTRYTSDIELVPMARATLRKSLRIRYFPEKLDSSYLGNVLVDTG